MPAGTLVVDVEGTDPDGDALSDWMIIGGNVDVDGDGNPAFTIDPNTGEITINDADDVDFETISSFDLEVTVSDGVLTSAPETITITINDVNEAPVVIDNDVTINENLPNGSIVVNVDGIDPDNDPLSDWMIIGGNVDVDGDGNLL